MGSSVQEEELVNPALPLEDLLWRLFSESDEVRVLSGKPLVKDAVVVKSISGM